MNSSSSSRFRGTTSDMILKLSKELVDLVEMQKFGSLELTTSSKEEVLLLKKINFVILLPLLKMIL